MGIGAVIEAQSPLLKLANSLKEGPQNRLNNFPIVAQSRNLRSINSRPRLFGVHADKDTDSQPRERTARSRQ
jgi:hypothetical protein